jgi:predicted Zn-dependent protease
MKPSGEPGGLTQHMLSTQMRLLDLASRSGPSECFARRTVSLSVRFEANSAVSAEEVDRAELALRVLRDGRVGIWGGSFIYGENALAECIERAEANARCGPCVETILADNKTPSRKMEALELPKPEQVVTLGHNFLTELQEEWPGFFWRGQLSVIRRTARVLHSGGLEAWSAWSEYKWSLRARGTGGKAPVDRMFEIRFGQWEEGAAALKARIRAEFPDSETMHDAPQGAPITLGPPIVAAMCLALIARALPENTVLAPCVTICDQPDPSYQGCDDEGVPIVPVPLVEAGALSAKWGTVSTTRRPTGRGIRRAIDSAPVLTPLGLRWRSNGHAPPKYTVLLPDLAGMSLQPGGFVQGTAVEGIVLCNGNPLYRCPGRVVRISVADALGTCFLGVSHSRFATGRHRLPYVTIQI